ncbi:adenylate/guanylate cyclase domain-containing protein [Bauldia sp.]|uniref:adenylate/guanylate cyclase domain-containing protein n=1 Tax=Bauldia sp. TaxID=2575872 RepID=UPI003BA98EDA
MPRLNLRNKLLLFAVVIAVIPLLIAGQSLIRIARDEMKSSANDQLVTTAGQITDEIDSLVDNAWMASIRLIRNAIDDEALGPQEKIALLRYGIADLPDVVALQISLVGSAVSPVVTQQDFADRLTAAGLDPLAVLKVPPETVDAFIDAGDDSRIDIAFVPETEAWLATLLMPLNAPFAGRPAVFSAQINLSQLAATIADHPFQQLGNIIVFDQDGHQVFDPAMTDLSDRDIIGRAAALLAASTPVNSIEAYAGADGKPWLGAFSFAPSLGWGVLVEKSEANAYYAVDVMIESLGLWIAVGLLIAGVGAIVFAVRISRPILRIGEAATEVGEGNFKARVDDVDSRDEIGDLARRINTMIGQINERFELAKFVSGGTIDAIQRSDEDGVKLGGERRKVAILFADIRGYTAFAESRDPELVVEVLNLYFQRQADLVAAHHGDIDKFVGDQLMAVFHGETMARDAVQCALAIQEVMVEQARAHPEWGLDIGIGVDMGEVVVGAMGSKQRMDFTVLGDHVNLAARLCSAAAPKQTLISDAIAAEVHSDQAFRLEPMEPIAVKGKAAPIRIYAVARSESAASHPTAFAEKTL